MLKTKLLLSSFLFGSLLLAACNLGAQAPSEGYPSPTPQFAESPGTGAGSIELLSCLAIGVVIVIALGLSNLKSGSTPSMQADSMTKEPAPPETAQGERDLNTEKTKKRIFIVHGHDDRTKLMAARLIERQGFDAILLEEQAGQGNTIIEKLEKCSDVDYALVLLTSDDVGSAKAELNGLQGRARQNVMFETGYFIAKLGRENMCLVHESGVEIPTDLQGIVYHSLEGGSGWQHAVLTELSKAGFAVDWSKFKSHM